MSINISASFIHFLLAGTVVHTCFLPGFHIFTVTESQVDSIDGGILLACSI